MKKNSKHWFYLLCLYSCSILFLFFQAACSKKGSISTTPAPTSTATTGTTSGGTTNGEASTEESCTGSASDGYDDVLTDSKNNPLVIYQVALGDKDTSWLPGNPPYRDDPETLSKLDSEQLSHCVNGPCDVYKDSAECSKGKSGSIYYCYDTKSPDHHQQFESKAFVSPIPLKSEAWEWFANDGDIFFKLRLDPMTSQNLEGYGGAYCYGRKPNPYGSYTPYKVPYTKMKFNLYARVLRKKPGSTCTGSSCTESDYTYTSTRTLIQSVEVNTNKCTKPIRIRASSFVGSNVNDAVVIEIGNIQTNGECLNSGGSSDTCPYANINKGNCWFGTIEIATNSTNFFKGFKRSDIP